MMRTYRNRRAIRSAAQHACALMLAGNLVYAETDPFSAPGPGKPAEMADIEAVSREPDHLVPVDPNPGDWHVRYVEQLRKHLNLKSSFFARMVEMPSFSGESSLSLHGEAGCDDIDATDQFRLTYYVADTSIWYSMPENNEEKVQKPVVVSVKTAPVPKDIALRVIALWERMLRRTRVPAKDNTGLDGATIEFSTPTGTGTTWSPMERKSPRLLCELGGSLTRYCEVPAGRRTELLKQITVQIETLDRYLDELPAK